MHNIEANFFSILYISKKITKNGQNGPKNVKKNNTFYLRPKLKIYNIEKLLYDIKQLLYVLEFEFKPLITKSVCLHFPDFLHTLE